MKIFTPASTACLLLAAAASSSSMVRAFTVRSSAAVPRRSNGHQRLWSSTDSNNSVEALRAAAAKAREEANRLAEELGKKVPAEASDSSKPQLPKKSSEEVQTMLPSILAETDVSKQIELWNDLKESDSISMFGSANLKTFPVSLSMLEQRAGLTSETLGLVDNNVDLDDFKYATLYVLGGCSVLGVAALALLPPNVGATVCYILALIPILFLGIGSSAPGIIAGAIASLKGVSGDDAEAAAERICRHEAAHFCCGYWSGLPVSGYSITDGGGQGGVPQVEFDIAASKYSNTEVAALAVTALAGLVGEAKRFEKAVGATQDLMTLEAVFRKSNEFIGAAAQQDITRWGALTAALLLKQHEDKYEQVVEAFQRQASIEDCIAILEN